MAIDKTQVETTLSAYTRNGRRGVLRRPRWLIAAWLALFAISILALVLSIFGTPAYFALYSTPCAACLDERLTPARIQALQALGISITAYWTAINLLFVLLYFVVAAFIFVLPEGPCSLGMGMNGNPLLCFQGCCKVGNKKNLSSDMNG